MARYLFPLFISVAFCFASGDTSVSRLNGITNEFLEAKKDENGNLIFCPVTAYRLLSLVHTLSYGNIRFNIEEILGSGDSTYGKPLRCNVEEVMGFEKLENTNLNNSLMIFFPPSYTNLSEELKDGLENECDMQATIEIHLYEEDPATQINKEVKKKTEIEELYPPNSLQPLPVFVITMVLEAKWKYPFDPADTRIDIFNSSRGKLQVDFMNLSDATYIYNHDEFYDTITISIPLREGRVVIYMPSNNFDEFMKNVKENGELTEALLKDAEKSDFNRGSRNLKLPKFEINASEYPIMKKFSNLGMNLRNSGLQTVNGKKLNLYIDDVKAVTTIKFDESGVEVKSVTSMITRMAIPVQALSVSIDRTFLFQIRLPYKDEEVIVATGVIDNPNTA